MAKELSELGRAERQILATCARVQLEADHLAKLETLLEEHLDWQQIVQHARLHSVAPLLYHHLRCTPAEKIPDAARAGLLQLYHRAAYQNRLYEEENGALLEAFDQASIRTLIPKGISILERIYGDLSLRPLIDLMFLVPAEQVTDVKKLLVGRGYVRDRPRPIHGLYRWSCPQLIYKTHGVIHCAVLVVWNLVNWPRLHRFETGAVWRHARPAMVSRHPTLLLSPEDLVLYLCQMADNHGYFNRVVGDELGPSDLLFTDWTNNRLVRFTDLHEAIRHHAEELRWDLVVQRAKESDLDAAAYASLRLAAAILGSAIDDWVLEELRPAGSRSSLRRRVFSSLVASELEGRRASRSGRIGLWWRSKRPYTQILLGRLMGWIEISFPNLEALRRTYRLRGHLPALVLSVAHASRSLIRSSTSYLALWTLRLAGLGAAPAASQNDKPVTDRPSR